MFLEVEEGGKDPDEEAVVCQHLIYFGDVIFTLERSTKHELHMQQVKSFKCSIFF